MALGPKDITLGFHESVSDEFLADNLEPKLDELMKWASMTPEGVVKIGNRWRIDPADYFTPEVQTILARRYRAAGWKSVTFCLGSEHDFTVTFRRSVDSTDAVNKKLQEMAAAFKNAV